MLARGVAWGVAASCGAAWAFSLWVAALPGAGAGQLRSYYLFGVAPVGATYAVMGAVLVTLRPRNILGWLLVGFGASDNWQEAMAAYGGYGSVVAQPAWPVADWIAAVAAGLWVFGVFGPPTLLLALYPDGRLSARWWRWPVGATVALLAVATIVMMASPTALKDIVPGGTPPVRLPAAVDAVLMPAIFVPYLALTSVIWMGTFLRLRRSRTPERPQLAWLACVVMPFLLVSILAPARAQSATIVLALGVPVAITVGVLRYRMLGLDLVLRRGLVYAGLTGLVLCGYAAAAAVAGTAIGHQPWPAVLAATVVTIGLAPARDRVGRAVDRLLYGKRDDPLRAVAQFGDRVADTADGDVLPTALATAVEVAGLDGAEVVALDGRVVARAGVQPAEGELLPLRVGGQAVGTLRVTPPADPQLLAALTPQVAAVVRAFELVEALEGERDRVVAATRLERDQLRHDLHEGLGPSLSGVGLGLQGLDDALRAGDTAVAAALIDRVGGEMTCAVEEVRRLVDELRH